MDFYETVMGKRFYTSDFPKLVRELEKMNESLGDIAGRMRAADEQRDDRKPKTKPSGAKPAYDGRAVERAISLLRRMEIRCHLSATTSALLKSSAA